VGEERGRGVLLVVAGIAMAGAGRGMGVLNCTEEIHCSDGPLEKHK
jgi:hypothetical protein